MYILSGKVIVISALARAMRRNGYSVSVGHVSRVMSGQREATDDFLEAFAKVMDVTKTKARVIVEQAQEASAEFRKMPKMVIE